MSLVSILNSFISTDTSMKLKLLKKILATVSVAFLLLPLIFYTVFPLRMYAVAPRFSGPYELKQPSGKIFVATEWGDKWSSHFITKEGHRIYKNNKTGNWEYYRYLNFRIIGLLISEFSFNPIVGEINPASLGPPNRHDSLIDFSIDSYASFVLTAVLGAFLIFFIIACTVLLYHWKRYDGFTNNKRFFIMLICLGVFIVLFGGCLLFLFSPGLELV